MKASWRAACWSAVAAVATAASVAAPAKPEAEAPPSATQPPLAARSERLVPPLADEQLDRIFSVRCLKVKQRHGGHVPCNHQAPEAIAQSETTAPPSPETLDIGTFPSWREPRCHSEGEFFCDPQALLSTEERRNLTNKIQLFRERTVVRCSQLPCKLAGVNAPYTRRFLLGVAIADEWPSSEADPMSLQRLGLVLLGRWGLLPWYNGVDHGNSLEEVISADQYSANCPNAAMLIILPRYREAFVSAPSCEFMCGDRGGPEVATATLAALEERGLAAAVEAGIETAQRWLSQSPPLSLERPPPGSKAAVKEFRRWERKLMRRSSVWTTAQHYLLVIMAVTIIAGVVASARFVFAPGGKERTLRRSR